MRLLISGDDSVGILDWSSGVTRLVAMPGIYRFDAALDLGSKQAIRVFGLTWHGRSSFFAACHERIGILDSDLTHRGFLDISPLWFMTHAITVRDNILYTCNSRIDVVGVHDLTSGVERFIDVSKRCIIPNPQHLKPLRDGYQYDHLHPNAVVVSDEFVFVLVHPAGPSSIFSEISVFDRDSLSYVHSIKLDERPFGVYYAHDLAIVNDVVVWCDTFRCCVRLSDGRSSKPLGNNGTFLRGLAVNETDIYVGLASQRGTEAPTAHIVRLNACTLSEIERVAIPFWTEICTIRIIDGLDYAHAGAGPSPLVRSD